ncbi:MAG: (d)CMP kinase [Alphaproteobacteria bacterium]|nr:(d)CMP kinase [Alphaproteobacteria bacterium]
MTNISPKFVIAIDGPAASGKGTLARGLAAALGFAYMDTGALYRAVARAVLAAGGDPENEAQALAGVGALRAALAAGDMSVLTGADLRSEAVAQGASKVAGIPLVRAGLLDVQRDFAENPGKAFAGAVLDGRDIGTVVCPGADLKLFVTADIAVRAERRRKELQFQGREATYEAVLAEMRARDARDQGREAAPLRSAPDAILLDSSGLSAEEALAEALRLAKVSGIISGGTER